MAAGRGAGERLGREDLPTGALGLPAAWHSVPGAGRSELAAPPRRLEARVAWLAVAALRRLARHWLGQPRLLSLPPVSRRAHLLGPLCGGQRFLRRASRGARRAAPRTACRAWPAGGSRRVPVRRQTGGEKASARSAGSRGAPAVGLAIARPRADRGRRAAARRMRTVGRRVPGAGFVRGVSQPIAPAGRLCRRRRPRVTVRRGRNLGAGRQRSDGFRSAGHRVALGRVLRGPRRRKRDGPLV